MPHLPRSSLQNRMFFFSLALLLLLSSSSRGFPEGFSRSLPSTGYEDFVGFSYSRALLPPSSSFIHFLQENTNINADFVPKYSSFRVTTPGIYGFQFSFSAMPKSGLAEVALLKDSIPIISAVGDKFGVSRFIMLPLSVGNVVQLQVMSGYISEDGKSSSTSFSGWLIAQPRSEVIRKPETCVCCNDQPPLSRTTPPPRPPPIYYQGHHSPVTPAPSCCNRVFLSHGPDSSVQRHQSEKLGAYKLLYKDGNGRFVYKHVSREGVYLYFFSRAGTNWRGWMIGPSPGGVMGGILAENEELCPDRSANWAYYASGRFRQSGSLRLVCRGEEDDDALVLDVGRSAKELFEHNHRHVHYHHHRIEGSRNGNVMLPFYSIKADPNVVSATFVYANNGSLSNSLPFGSNSSPALLH